MPYTVKRYEELFIDQQLSLDDYLESLRDKDILKYHTQFIKSGSMLEIMVYPVWKTSKAKAEAAAPKPSRQEQVNLNHANAQKRAVRLMNTNFTHKDVWATFTYDDEHLPQDDKEAQRNIQNYIRRLRAYIQKNGLPELKYMYVTECRAEDGEMGRVHHHIVMNFRDRDMAEAIWDKGGRKHTRRLQPDDYGLEGLARYITKEKADTPSRKHSKKFATSQNLDKPAMAKQENLIRKRKAAAIDLDRNSAQGIFEEIAKKTLKQGYTFLDMEVKHSRYVSGVYLHVRMKEAPRAKKRGTRA